MRAAVPARTIDHIDEIDAPAVSKEQGREEAVHRLEIRQGQISFAAKSL